MKRCLSLFFLLGLSAPLFAEVALVYKSEGDVKKTVFSQGVVTTEGVVVSAVGILAASDNLLVGLQGQELKKAALVRFDNDLNLALVRGGERISNEGLQAAHKKNSEKISLFLPEQGLVPAPVPSTAEKYAFKINDVLVATETVVIPKSHKKANLSLLIIGRNVTPSWRLTLDLEAEPVLYFWKKGDERGLNAIPVRRLHLDHQSLLGPYGNGDTLKWPVEVSSIKEENYNLKIKIDSKDGVFEKTIPVRFVEK